MLKIRREIGWKKILRHILRCFMTSVQLTRPILHAMKCEHNRYTITYMFRHFLSAIFKESLQRLKLCPSNWSVMWGNIKMFYSYSVPVPVAARLLRLWVRIPTGSWIFICCECCVLSGRGLCDELITCPEESYRLWCVVLCNLETSRMLRPWPALGRSVTKK
jgi:hypothetical protein